LAPLHIREMAKEEGLKPRLGGRPPQVLAGINQCGFGESVLTSTGLERRSLVRNHGLEPF
jgi:hypothetical protein